MGGGGGGGEGLSPSPNVKVAHRPGTRDSKATLSLVINVAKRLLINYVFQLLLAAAVVVAVVIVVVAINLLRLQLHHLLHQLLSIQGHLHLHGYQQGQEDHLGQSHPTQTTPVDNCKDSSGKHNFTDIFTKL